MERNKRIEWIDIFRGIVIIWVILGHLNGVFVKYAYLFHMPAFFFISGVTFNEDSNFNRFVLLKIKRILIPMYITK